ncbi:hypothetical protein JVU11DRAFT_127 [Chiua virens]|nr:hypothetical protein JVU11DRAFT_127 [Chiua virens]
MSFSQEAWATTMEYQVDFSLPGGDSFYDVTQMFADAAAGRPSHNSYTSLFTFGPQDMPPGDLVLAKDFTLQDAMAAFEVGDTLFGRTRRLQDRKKIGEGTV